MEYAVVVGDVDEYLIEADSEEEAIQYVLDNHCTREDLAEYRDDPGYIWAYEVEDELEDVDESSDINCSIEDRDPRDFLMECIEEDLISAETVALEFAKYCSTDDVRRVCDQLGLYDIEYIEY